MYRERRGAIEYVEEHFLCAPGYYAYVFAVAHGPCVSETLRVYWSGASTLDALLPPHALRQLADIPHFASSNIRPWCIDFTLHEPLVEPGRVVVVYEWRPPTLNKAQILVRPEDGHEVWASMSDIRDAIQRGF